MQSVCDTKYVSNMVHVLLYCSRVKWIRPTGQHFMRCDVRKQTEEHGPEQDTFTFPSLTRWLRLTIFTVYLLDVVKTVMMLNVQFQCKQNLVAGQTQAQ